MMLFNMLSLLLLIVSMVYADVYMHNPRGSNNRLNEKTRERDEDNRLFDSQNNERGGYNKAGGEKDDIPMKFLAGSELLIEWTNQHQCGGANTKCDIVIQYMCEPQIRDGNKRSKIDAGLDRRDDTERGMHEDQEYYANCKGRQRDKGLYHADQKLNGNSAIYTRQNPGGGRSGLECPEERDYYPYPMPTPWRDIAILTNEPTKKRCDEIRKNSQNDKPKWYCKFNEKDDLKNAGNNNLAPTTEQECKEDTKKFTWKKVESYGLDTPDCKSVPKSRDNHNGNTEPEGSGSASIPQTSSYKWKIPNTPASKCVLRMRYNITAADYDAYNTNSNHDAEANKKSKIYIGAKYGIPRDEVEERGYKIKNNPIIRPLKVGEKLEKKLQLELAINTAQLGRVFQDRSHRFAILESSSKIAKIHNLNVRGRRGNIVQLYPAVEYDFVPNQLDVDKNDHVHIQWTGSLTNPQNDDGEGTPGTDKNNMINLAAQTYWTKKTYGGNGFPSNSYPQPLNVGTFLDLDITNATKAAVPKKGDKPPAYYKVLPNDEPEENDMFIKEWKMLEDEVDEVSDMLSIKKETDGDENKDETTDDDDDDEQKDAVVGNIDEINDDESQDNEQSKQDVNDPKAVARPSRRRRSNRRRRTSRRRGSRRRSSSSRRRSTANANGVVNSLLNDAPPYVDLGPQKVTKCGIYNFMCTRNNNFSNRSQKGKVNVCPQ